MRKILLSLIILLFFSASFAQKNNFLKSKRIAFIYQPDFVDKSFGIKKYVKAMESMDSGFIYETDPVKRKAIFAKRYETTVEPVEKEISAFLEKIETQNDIEIYDAAAFKRKGQILALNKNLDITVRVVELINLYFEIGREPLLTLSIPESKIAVIDSKSFFNKKTGIVKFRKQSKKAKSLFKLQISAPLRTFSEKFGFGVVFDSSRGLPMELQNFQFQDITKNFVSYYNQLNP